MDFVFLEKVRIFLEANTEKEMFESYNSLFSTWIEMCLFEDKYFSKLMYPMKEMKRNFLITVDVRSFFKKLSFRYFDERLLGYYYILIRFGIRLNDEELQDLGKLLKDETIDFGDKDFNKYSKLIDAYSRIDKGFCIEFYRRICAELYLSDEDVKFNKMYKKLMTYIK